jgi:hypothetical protein
MPDVPSITGPAEAYVDRRQRRIGQSTAMSAMRQPAPAPLGALSMRVAVHAPAQIGLEDPAAVVPEAGRGDAKTIENTPPLPEGTVMVGLATAARSARRRHVDWWRHRRQ